MPRNDIINVRCTVAEKAAWKRAAGPSGLSEWLRSLATAASTTGVAYADRRTEIRAEQDATLSSVSPSPQSLSAMERIRRMAQ